MDHGLADVEDAHVGPGEDAGEFSGESRRTASGEQS